LTNIWFDFFLSILFLNKKGQTSKFSLLKDFAYSNKEQGIVCPINLYFLVFFDLDCVGVLI